MRSVALFGQMASGKSSIANILIEEGFIRMSFAGPLKSIAELAYGPVDKAANYRVTRLEDGREHILSGREILQGVGQSIKSHDRDFWLRCFFRSADNLAPNPLVVDDGRFTFERDALRERDWLVVGIQTPREERHARYLAAYGRYPTPEEESHQSEIELPDIIAAAELRIDGTDSPIHNAGRILELADTR